MGVGSGLYMNDVVVKRSRLLSHFLMSSYYYYYYKICIAHKFKHARVEGADILNLWSLQWLRHLGHSKIND